MELDTRDGSLSTCLCNNNLVRLGPTPLAMLLILHWLKSQGISHINNRPLDREEVFIFATTCVLIDLVIFCSIPCDPEQLISGDSFNMKQMIDFYKLISFQHKTHVSLSPKCNKPLTGHYLSLQAHIFRHPNTWTPVVNNIQAHHLLISVHITGYNNLEYRDGAVVRALASHPRGPGSILRSGVMWVEFVGSPLCTGRFSPGTPVSPLLKNHHLTWFVLMVNLSLQCPQLVLPR